MFIWMRRLAASMAMSTACARNSETALRFSSSMVLRAACRRLSLSWRAAAISSVFAALTSCWFLRIISADSSRAFCKVIFISAAAASAPARSRLAASMASPMVFSRVSIIWMIGPQANLPRTMSRRPKVIAVQKLSAKLTSVRLAASNMKTSCEMRDGEPKCFGPRLTWTSLLDGEDDADDFSEQRHAFDERGGDDHRSADVAGAGRLPRRTFHRGRRQLPDAESGAENGESCPEACSEIPERKLVHWFSSYCASMPRAPAARSGRL